VAAFITYLLDIYDLIVLAIAMPVLLKVLDMSLPGAGLLGSATMLGAMAGGVLFGLIAENRGRRFALILALLWLGLGMGAVYPLVSTWEQWIVSVSSPGSPSADLWTLRRSHRRTLVAGIPGPAPPRSSTAASPSGPSWPPLSGGWSTAYGLARPCFSWERCPSPSR
jgi:MFS family permease